MAQFGDVAWKEGRAGAASLVYIGLNDAQLARVAENHAAVFIRATLACSTPTAHAATLAARNWDLAMQSEHADERLAAELRGLDARNDRGVVSVGEHEPESTRLYHIGNARQTIPTPQPSLDRPLGSLVLPADLEQAKRSIDGPVVAGEWGIWRIDGATFDTLTPDTHKRLLQWLGDHHGRIWCAPVRDIATWQP